jgi:cyclic pyranopterin phosphate synthase
MRDLRVSVTDRCNFRCLYCLPETEAAFNFYRGRWATVPNPRPIEQKWAARSTLLTFEEIERVVRILTELGIQKVRLTGGEPLLRQQIETLVEKLVALPGLRDLALTTNGFHFRKRAEALREAGLHRVSFSLDSLDPANFQKLTGRDALREVLAGIRQAQEMGLNPVKVNAVIIRGVNDHEIESLAEFGRDQGLSFRFIEFMPLDSARVWLQEMVVPAREILERLQSRFDLQPVVSTNPSETARRWRFPDGSGEIGLIAPVSEPFCGHCNRIRLTADGQIRTCLFSVQEHDLRSRLRNGASDAELKAYVQEVVRGKEPGHRIGEQDFVAPVRSMSCIGG